MEFGVIPPERRDSQRHVAGRFDQQINGIASFGGFKEWSPITIEVKAMKRRSVTPKQGLGSSVESEMHGTTGHRLRKLPPQTKPGRAPYRPPSPTGLHLRECVLRKRPDLIVRGAIFELGHGDFKWRDHWRRHGSEYVVGEGLESKRGVFKIGKHGGYLRGVGDVTKGTRCDSVPPTRV